MANGHGSALLVSMLNGSLLRRLDLAWGPLATACDFFRRFLRRLRRLLRSLATLLAIACDRLLCEACIILYSVTEDVTESGGNGLSTKILVAGLCKILWQL